MISFIIPAFNEEFHLPGSVETVIAAATSIPNITFEIIIVDDGSTDGTAKVCDELAQRHPFVHALHNEENMGLGRSVRRALEIAQHEKFMIVPGDGDIDAGTVVNLLRYHDRADLIITYLINREKRGPMRNAISSLYNMIYMFTFGLYLMYINGPAIYPTNVVRGLKLKSNRFSIVCEMTVKMLCMGCSFAEVPGYMRRGAEGSTALRWKNLVEVVAMFLHLVWEIRFENRDTYSRQPHRIEI